MLAPVVSFIPAFMTFAVIPFASEAMINGSLIRFQVANLNVGLIYVLAIGSLGVYGIIMAGWASNNKYALLGSLRSSSQMISYELSMGLVGDRHRHDLLRASTWVTSRRPRADLLFQLGPLAVPAWGIFIQPLGLPDLPDGGVRRDQSTPVRSARGRVRDRRGLSPRVRIDEVRDLNDGRVREHDDRFGDDGDALFRRLAACSGRAGSGEHALHLQGGAVEWLRVLFEMACFFAKVGFFMWFFVWVRWTLPRFRYDQLMDLGWKIMLPLSLVNIFITGGMIY